MELIKACTLVEDSIISHPPRKFIIYSASNSPDEIRVQYERYQAYLDSVGGQMPESAFEFAKAPFHYDPSDPRCPHDSWLVSLTIKEDQEERSEMGISIAIELLGAYHDGNIRFDYEKVYRYSLQGFAPHATLGDDVSRPEIHQDWLWDEVYLDDSDKVVHDIEFASGARWIIVCKNLRYRWLPFY